MWRPLVRPLIRGLVRSLVGSVTTVIVPALKRWVYNFDGVDDRGQFAFRAINPDGDIDIEFRTGNVVPPVSVARCIVDQSITATFTAKEFYLQINTSGRMQITHGGSFLSSHTAADPIKPNTTYRVTLIGNVLTYFQDGVSQTINITRGAAREPAAATKICAWSVGASHSGYYSGQLHYVKINGVLYPVADRNQAIQLPLPSGLGAELITPAVLENPVSKGNQWTLLSGGRWQYVGDGTLNTLDFISSVNQPESGFIEFEVESYSGTGTMTCAQTPAGNPVNAIFNDAGVKRYYYTSKGVSNGNTVQFKRNSGSVSCVIKNISFKSMGTSTQVSSNLWTSPTANTLTTNTPTAVSASVNSDFLAVQKALEGLVAGSTYTIRLTSNASGFYGVNIAGASVFAGTGIQNLTRTFVATGTSVLLSMDSAEAASGSLTITSFERVSCNPLTLTNTTPERWEEVVGELPKTRFVYNFDGVDDRGQLATRAINPDGNIVIKWEQRNLRATAYSRVVVSQQINSSASSREFLLALGTGGQLVLQCGGASLTLGTGNLVNGNYEFSLINDTVKLLRDGVEVVNSPFTRGASREPTAVTLVGALTAGTINTYGNWFAGELLDVEINGVLWKMDEPYQSIQLPTPNGLGAELITQSVLENPNLKGSQWTYLGAGRWQYIGDGSFNELTFIHPTQQPAQAFLEFEIESITGQIACVQASSAISRGIFNSIGIKRYFYTDRNEASANGGTVTFKRPTNGLVTSCIIKNISFKPLGTCNPLTLTNTTQDRWTEVLE